MGLPKIDVPIYDVTLPSSGKTVKIRPFLVKEEKLLLMAVESKDNENIIKTTKQVINNCIVASDIDVEKLPFFDIDYLFIALRAKSIGENLEMSYTCNNATPEGKCGGVFQADIDISNCVIDKNEDIGLDVKLSNTLSIKMKYPTYSIMKAIMGNETIMEKKIRVICSCVDRVVNGDKVYTTKDFSKEELNAFVEGLTQEQYKKLEEFVDNLPSFYIESKSLCPKCQYEHTIKYTDFTRFFQ
jgi:hypothetical protein